MTGAVRAAVSDDRRRGGIPASPAVHRNQCTGGSDLASLATALLASAYREQDLVYLFSAELEEHAGIAGLPPALVRDRARTELDVTPEEEALAGRVATDEVLRGRYRELVTRTTAGQRPRVRDLLYQAAGGVEVSAAGVSCQRLHVPSTSSRQPESSPAPSPRVPGREREDEITTPPGPETTS